MPPLITNHQRMPHDQQDSFTLERRQYKPTHHYLRHLQIPQRHTNQSTTDTALENKPVQPMIGPTELHKVLLPQSEYRNGTDTRPLYRQHVKVR